MDSVDAVVIGAGVVGLACAAALARSGDEVVVVERHPGIAFETSSRNSEVIHAGMYYPTGSLKQRLCVEGRRLLYDFAAERGVSHRKCGKLIVATNEGELGAIEAIHARGVGNGVEDLVWLTAASARGMEPALACVGALWSPETGIVSSHEFAEALRTDFENLGGVVALGTPLEAIEVMGAGDFVVRTGGTEPFRLASRKIVNAAGLWAQAVAARIEGLDPACVPDLVLAKGSYFSCLGAPAFSRLIYPAPVSGGLGVHVTLDLAGRVRFGPDVEWLKTSDPAAVDYAVDPARGMQFYAAVRRYWPGLPDGALQPDYSGCRPKLRPESAEGADFRIDGPDRHGVEGLVNLFGIESPGLTSALSIAKMVEESIRRGSVNDLG
jgi:L-2-hydroxyglutarate oxidase LhgO